MDTQDAIDFIGMADDELRYFDGRVVGGSGSFSDKSEASEKIKKAMVYLGSAYGTINGCQVRISFG